MANGARLPSELPPTPVTLSREDMKHIYRVALSTDLTLTGEQRKAVLEALERETSRLNELRHNNIIKLLDSSYDNEHLTVFLERMPAGSIATLLERYGVFEDSLVHNLTLQVLNGVQYLHDQNIIHGDIKGDNVLIDNRGTIKITGFGVLNRLYARSLVRSERPRASFHGSLYWAAPEVAKHTSYTPKVDVWAVGCLVIEMLTREHPWPQLTQTQVVSQLCSLAKPPFPPKVFPETEDFLNTAFEIDPNLRPSAQELLLHPWVSGVVTGTRRCSRGAE